MLIVYISIINRKENTVKILNAFSINMLPGDCNVSFEKIIPYKGEKGFESYIGHADTAAVISDVLGVDLPMNRQSVTLERDETVIVAQYTGPRLPEGSTRLPEGATITFWQVSNLDWY